MERPRPSKAPRLSEPVAPVEPRPRPSRAPQPAAPVPQQEQAVVAVAVVPPGLVADSTSWGDCPVDGTLVQAADKDASRWYLFTQVTEDVPRPGRKTPEEVGREGLYKALVETYSKVFKPQHPCHAGPEFGKVVQEGHPRSTVSALKNLHNHAACQFPSRHKWKTVEKHMREVLGIKVHISRHPCYRTAYDYVSTATDKKPEAEIDKDFYMSAGHPAFQDLPEPDERMLALWRARGKADEQKTESMKVLEFYDVVRGLPAVSRTEDSLWALANEQQDSGERRLMSFMLGRRDLVQLLERVDKAEAAPTAAARAQKSRVSILDDVVRDGKCTCTDCGRWRRAADEIMQFNGYVGQELQSAVLEALELGRSKKRNIVIVGATNRAKSFCLKPLQLVYETFKPPDGGSHQLEDLKGCEILWLNEFEHDPSFLAWRKLKDFLEGEPLKVAVPKTRGKNYTFSSDAPVFGTAPGPIEHPKSQSETDQMMSRIRYFVFEHYFDPDFCPDIKPCAFCFAQWVLVARGRPHGPPGPPHPRLSAYLARNRPEPSSSSQNSWLVQRPGGTYQQSDHPGCFKCGSLDHFVRDCPID